MNATKTYQKATETAQAWASNLAQEVDLDKLDVDKMKASAEQAAQAASTWAADASADAAARASKAAHVAGDWLEQVSGTATDWVEEQSAKAMAMLPAAQAARRARRRRWIFGSVIALGVIFYFYDPDKGRTRRAKVKNMFSKQSEPTTTSSPSFSTQTVNEATAEDLEPENAND